MHDPSVMLSENGRSSLGTLPPAVIGNEDSTPSDVDCGLEEGEKGATEKDVDTRLRQLEEALKKLTAEKEKDQEKLTKWKNSYEVIVEQNGDRVAALEDNLVQLEDRFDILEDDVRKKKPAKRERAGKGDQQEATEGAGTPDTEEPPDEDLESRVLNLEEDLQALTDEVSGDLGTLQTDIQSLERGRPKKEEEDEPVPMACTDSSANGVIIRLPESLWSSALVTSIAVTPGWEYLFTWAIVCLPQWLGLAFVIFGQVSFIVYLKKIVDSKMPESCSDETALQFICIAAPIMMCLEKDIKQAIEISRWVCEIPSWDEDDNDLLYGKAGPWDADFCGVWVRRITDKVDNTMYEFYTGCSQKFKFFAHFMLLGRIVLACTLLYFSCAFVLYASSTEHVIINCVATVLFLNLDVYTYAIINTAITKKVMIQVPPIGVPQHRLTFFDQFYTCFLPWLGFLIALGLTLTLQRRWCTTDSGVHMSAALGFGIPIALILCCCCTCVWKKGEGGPSESE